MYKKLVPADVYARRFAVDYRAHGRHFKPGGKKTTRPSRPGGRRGKETALEQEITALRNKCARLFAELRAVKQRTARETEQRVTAQHKSMRRLLLPVLRDLEDARSSINAVQASKAVRRRSQRTTAAKSRRKSPTKRAIASSRP